jgi:3-methyladenine DNA glycosylase AlkD
VQIISSKAIIKPIVDNAVLVYKTDGMAPFISVLHDTVLKKKVKYPVLEYVSQELYKNIPPVDHVSITDRVIELKENGSDVIAGKILQLRLQAHYEECLDKAEEYIIYGANWLSCDTVAERVFGHALLTLPEKTIPILQRLAAHENNWVIRAVGVAVHYAVKKGLKKAHAETMFTILLSLSSTTDFHTKKGVGWAAKTIAKFHPDIVAKYDEQIQNSAEIRQWFKTKLKIGAGRSFKYAHRYTS